MEDCSLKGWSACNRVKCFFVVTDTDLCNPYTVVVSLVESDVLLNSSHSHNKNRFSWRLWFVWFCKRRLMETTKKANCWIWLFFLCGLGDGVFLNTFFYFLLFMKVNALHLANIQLTKGFLSWIIRSTCVAQMSECNQPQGTDWILPAHDGDALQCNGCSTGFPESQSPWIRRGMKEKRGIRMAFIGLWLPLS